MSLLVTNCPRCHTEKITFDVHGVTQIGTKYNWQRHFEAFTVCRHCNHSTVFVLSQRSSNTDGLFREGPGIVVSYKGTVNDFLDIEGYINIRDNAAIAAPDHLPKSVKEAFEEGATCLAVECWNAAGTMFRMCVDLATSPLLPQEEVEGLNKKIRRDLGLRLPWLLANGRLSSDLKELSTCIKEDGNDGAHAGTLKKEDAYDLLDFTQALLERRYTEPERLKLAQARRTARRKKSEQGHQEPG